MNDKSSNPGCLGFLFSFLRKPSNEVPSREREENELAKEYHYTRNETLLSVAENSFFHVLNQVFTNDYNVFSKVRLADIISVKGKRWQQGFNKIKAKHIDYIIVESGTSKILLAIELDDSSHNTKKAQKSDEVKDECLGEAGVPILRIKAAHSYNVEEIKKQVAVILG